MRHRTQLESFIVRWRPQLKGNTDFGKDIPEHHTYICPADQAQVDCIDIRVKLEAIRFTQINDNYLICGMQLIFSNGVTTPFIETPRTAGENLIKRELKIDPEQTIGKISLREFGSMSSYSGIRFYDQCDKLIAEHMMEVTGIGVMETWHDFKVPQG